MAEDAGLLGFIIDHAGVVISILTLLCSFCIFLLAERDRAQKELHALKDGIHAARITALEHLISQQSATMEKAVEQMHNIATALHGRVTDLSESYHKLQGEHNSKMATCPLNGKSIFPMNIPNN